MHWHFALQQFTSAIKHFKGEENLGDILSRIDLSESKIHSLNQNHIYMLMDMDSVHLHLLENKRPRSFIEFYF